MRATPKPVLSCTPTPCSQPPCPAWIARIPAFHYMVAVAGGLDIRCASYATFGTQELSDAVVAALADRKACLMSHHGMIVFSDTLASALALAVEVETLCGACTRRALQVGEPSILPEAEMARVLEKFEGYGKS